IEAIKHYKNKGWIDKMIKELQEAEADYMSFKSDIQSNILFNIRFKKEDFEPFGEGLLEFLPDQQLVKIDRYNLFNKKDEIELEIEDEPPSESDEISAPRKGKRSKGSGIIKRSFIEVCKEY